MYLKSTFSLQRSAVASNGIEPMYFECDLATALVSDQCTASNASVWRPYLKGRFSRRRRLSWSVFCCCLKRLSNSHTGTGRSQSGQRCDDDHLALHYTAVGSSPFYAWRTSVQENWHSFYNIRFVLKNVIKK